jgi:hypothetical protein
MVGSGEVYRCEITDTFRLERGQIRRDRETEYWRDLLHPVVVDTATGMVTMGPDGTPLRWGIQQQGAGDWDFVAVQPAFGEAALSTIRIRVWEDPVQIVVDVNGFMFAVGVCEPIPRSTAELEDT